MVHNFLIVQGCMKYLCTASRGMCIELQCVVIMTSVTSKDILIVTLIVYYVLSVQKDNVFKKYIKTWNKCSFWQEFTQSHNFGMMLWSNRLTWIVVYSWISFVRMDTELSKFHDFISVVGDNNLQNDAQLSSKQLPTTVFI